MQREVSRRKLCARIAEDVFSGGKGHAAYRVGTAYLRLPWGRHRRCDSNLGVELQNDSRGAAIGQYNPKAQTLLHMIGDTGSRVACATAVEIPCVTLMTVYLPPMTPISCRSYKPRADGRARITRSQACLGRATGSISSTKNNTKAVSTGLVTAIEENNRWGCSLRFFLKLA
jgi:hypothetical protein